MVQRNCFSTGYSYLFLSFCPLSTNWTYHMMMQHNITTYGQIASTRFIYFLIYTYSFILIFNSIMSSAVIINGLNVIAERISNEQQACNPILSIALNITNKQTKQWSSKASNKNVNPSLALTRKRKHDQSLQTNVQNPNNDAPLLPPLRPFHRMRNKISKDPVLSFPST